MKKITYLLMSLMVLCFVITGCGSPKDKGEITVSAAASLKEPLNEIIDEFQKESGVKANLNFGSSGSLQKQIENGAPVDVFISAGKKQMDELEDKKLIATETREDILGNTLVVISSKNYKGTLNSFEDLIDQNVKIAIGEVKTVPAGQYADEALKNMGVFDKLKDKFLYAKDVKSVLAYVENGEAEVGIVYLSDAVGLKNSQKAFEISEKAHKPIVYSAAAIASSKNISGSKEFIKFLSSSEAKKAFKKYGFKVKED